PHDLDFAEGGLVDEGDALAHGAMLGADMVEPVGLVEGWLVLRLDTRRREPVGPLPAAARTVYGAFCREDLIEWAASHPAGGFMLRARIPHRIVLPVEIDGSRIGEAFRGVMVGEAADVERPEVEARPAIDDPFGHHLAGPAAAGNPIGKASADEGVV